MPLPTLLLVLAIMSAFWLAVVVVLYAVMKTRQRPEFSEYLLNDLRDNTDRFISTADRLLDHAKDQLATLESIERHLDQSTGPIPVDPSVFD